MNTIKISPLTQTFSKQFLIKMDKIQQHNLGYEIQKNNNPYNPSDVILKSMMK
jgi:hypothetical protein